MSDQTLNQFVASGTTAERTAFTPSPPTPASGPDPGYLWWDTDTQTEWSYDFGMADWVELAGGGGGGNVNAGGTLTSNAIVIGQGSTDVAVTTTAAGILTFIGTPSSANLAAALTDETGTGAAVFANTPTLVTPVLGTPTSGALTNCTSIPVNQATGDLPFANLTQIAGLSVLGVTGSATADVAAITAGTDNHVLTRVSSSSLAFALPAMVKIEEQSPSGTGVVTFSSLGAFTHLKIVFSARGTQAANTTDILGRFNGDTGANYDVQLLDAFGSTVSATEALAQTSMIFAAVAGANASSAMAVGGTIDIFDYRGTTFNKRTVTKDNVQTNTSTGTLHARQWSNNWRSTAAITSITLTLASGNYVAGSKFTLYGLS